MSIEIVNLALADYEKWAEFKGHTVDILEDMLSEKGATIENEDRDRAIKDGDDEEGLAIIYGDDYDAIGDEAENCIIDGQLDTKSPRLTFDEVADRIMEAYKEICDKAEFPENNPLTDADMAGVRTQLLDMLRNWDAGK